MKKGLRNIAVLIAASLLICGCSAKDNAFYGEQAGSENENKQVSEEIIPEQPPKDESEQGAGDIVPEQPAENESEQPAENGGEQGSGEVVPEETLESNPDSSWAVGRFPVPTND